MEEKRQLSLAALTMMSLFLLFIFAMLVYAPAAHATVIEGSWAAGTQTGGGTYSFDDETGTLIIEGKPDSNGVGRVSSIFTANGTFGQQYSQQVKHLVIKEGTTTLKMRFSDYKNLESVELPASLQELYLSSFNGDVSLSSVTIATGSQISSLGSMAFRNCTALESLDLSGTQLTSIGDPTGGSGDGSSPFQGSGLKEIKLPETLTTIGGFAFNGCQSLESVYVPSGVTAVKDYAFSVCSSLKTIYVPATLQTFADNSNGLANHAGIEVVVYGGSTAPECVSALTTSTTQFAKLVTVSVPQATADKIAALDVTAENYTTAADEIAAARAEYEGLSDAAKSVLNTELIEAKLDVAQAKADMYTAQAAQKAAEDDAAQAKEAQATAEAEAVKAAQDACETAGIAYDADKSVAENVAAAQAASETNAAKAACEAAGIAYDEAKGAAENLAAAKQAVAQAKTDLETAQKTQSDADQRLAQIAKNVKTVTVNVKTVTSAAIAKAIKAVGGDANTVTTIVLGSKVKTVKASAFKAYKKVTTVKVQTKKLTKKRVKNALKGSKVKTVRIDMAGSKTHAKYAKKYKKIFTKKVAGKKAAVK